MIFLTGKTKISDKVLGLTKGCDYYLTKPYSFEELLAVVQRLLARKTEDQENIEELRKLKAGDLVLDFMETKAFLRGDDVCLTKTEFVLLKTFMEHKGEELSVDQIYEFVWKKTSNGDARNVRKHIMNLRNKIRADQSDDYDILTSYGRGYTFVEY